jgi:hypothetical protein
MGTVQRAHDVHTEPNSPVLRRRLVEWAGPETECLMPSGDIDQYLDVPEASSYLPDCLTDLPEHTYTPLAAFEAAVDGAYTDFELRLVAQHDTQLRPAA